MSSQAMRFEPGVLNGLFNPEAYRYDLLQGVVNAAGERVIYLTEDWVKGIHAGLVSEAGEAWGLILKSCGHVWGRRLALALEQQVRQASGAELGALAVDEYVAVLEAYFARHGFGVLRLNLEDAEAHGVVRASLRHSLFAASLRQDGPVDYLVAGLLQGLFERIADCSLECLQIGYEQIGVAGSQSGFVLTAPARIEALSERLDSLTMDVALAALRVA